ncbi:PLDc N-terminal domain-containing protein [Streptomyces sp. Qhu-G9]|uniref:SHOCT domain-containing protein n=1 Tax=Streptomyces sp. Qhu-G9 TaxID=3452799 RepID=UPI0022AC09FD|nr:PLDc N-terminal domain-containing protein [Streptomyces aurantiacus]WAU83392.1 PLDc N-terminal domain-containing protein [Streptomyces aurantiacus]
MSGQMNLAYDYPLLSVFSSMLLFFLWIMWFVLLFRVVVDLFRDDNLSGWAKAGWMLFVLFLPFLGVFVYVIARGRNMGRREVAQARAQQEAFTKYVREAAQDGGRPSSVDELARLSEIRGRGDITDEEFRRAKELVLSGSGPSGQTDAASAASGR